VLREDARVDIEIFSYLGNRISEFHFEPGQEGGRAGQNTIVWNGRNRLGYLLGSSGYIVRIKAQLKDGRVVQSTKKVALIVQF